MFAKTVTKASKNGALISLSLSLLMWGVAGCSHKPTDQSAESSNTADADTASAPTFENLQSVDQVQQTNDQKQAPPENSDQQTQAAAPAPSAPSGSGEMATYTVQKEDTLMKIAFNVYGDIMKWKSIYELNKDKIKDTNALVVGAQLQYEKPSSDPQIDKNGDPYLIKNGDTLGTISYDVYGAPSKWKKLWENNKSLIKNPNKIYAGFYLYYQITEEEKQQAEKLKAAHPRQMGMGSGVTNKSVATNTPDMSPPPTDPAPASPSAQAPAPTQPSAPPAVAPNPDASGSGLSGFLQKVIPNRAPAGKN